MTSTAVLALWVKDGLVSVGPVKDDPVPIVCPVVVVHYQKRELYTGRQFRPVFARDFPEHLELNFFQSCPHLLSA